VLLSKRRGSTPMKRAIAERRRHGGCASREDFEQLAHPKQPASASRLFQRVLELELKLQRGSNTPLAVAIVRVENPAAATTRGRSRLSSCRAPATR